MMYKKFMSGEVLGKPGCFCNEKQRLCLSQLGLFLFSLFLFVFVCPLFYPMALAYTYVTLTIETSSSGINTDQTVDISGTITLTIDDEKEYAEIQNDFLEERLKLIRMDPYGKYDSIIVTQPFLYGDQLQYKFEGVKLPDAGVWKLLVASEKSEDFEKANSPTIDIDVQGITQDVAGYAILIEGRIKGNPGIDSHNLTANYIYNKLLSRGFKEEDVYYFNFNESQDGVDKKPTKKRVLNAIKVWARDKMNESPAPLYIIYVGPGKKEKVYIYPDTIDADELSGALNNLESELNTSAAQWPLVVILGANRSGSFIGALSKPDAKRIIIASSDTKEVAYKGPLAPEETIRHGDYFLYEFFSYIGKGKSLRKGCEIAAEKIAAFTENENGNSLGGGSAGNGQYFDKAAQHPLLDDNGDGIGTFKSLSSTDGDDGVFSSDLVLGIGTTTSFVELTGVTDVIGLESGTSTPELFAKVNDVTRVDKVWIEIASPGHSLDNDTDATEQQAIDLPVFSYNTFDEAGNKYLWNDFGDDRFDNFGNTGRYEILYFARDTETDEIASLMDSEVYKNKEGNQLPSPPDVISPVDGIEIAVAWTFDWEDSIDPDGETEDTQSEGITYTFTISESSSFDTIYYRQKGLFDSITTVDKTAELQDGVTYYWRVWASDANGGVIVGSTGSFWPKFTNYPGFIKGYIFDNGTNAKIGGATILAEGVEGSYSTTKSGVYFLQLLSGTYTVSAVASGYGESDKDVYVKPLDTITQNIGLETVNTQPAGISGVVKEQNGGALEGVTVKVKNKAVSKETTTDSDGNYLISELEAGKYKLTAKKNGYKSYKKKIKLKAGQDRELHISLKKK